jgi:hypothetical protein
MFFSPPGIGWRQPTRCASAPTGKWLKAAPTRLSEPATAQSLCCARWDEKAYAWRVCGLILLLFTLLTRTMHRQRVYLCCGVHESRPERGIGGDSWQPQQQVHSFEFPAAVIRRR